jgi:hypothetical protein
MALRITETCNVWSLSSRGIACPPKREGIFCSKVKDSTKSKTGCSFLFLLLNSQAPCAGRQARGFSLAVFSIMQEKQERF